MRFVRYILRQVYHCNDRVLEYTPVRYTFPGKHMTSI